MKKFLGRGFLLCKLSKRGGLYSAYSHEYNEFEDYYWLSCDYGYSLSEVVKKIAKSIEEIQNFVEITQKDVDKDVVEGNYYGADVLQGRYIEPMENILKSKSAILELIRRNL